MLGFLIDLDGTIYRGGVTIPKAKEFVEILKEKKIPFLFVTNNSSRTSEMVANHLQKMGINTQAEEIYTSAQGAVQYIVEHQIGKKVYMIGEKGLEVALTKAGFILSEEEQVDAVVQGIDRRFTYEKLAKAIQFIHLGAEFINTNPDHLLPSDEGPIPGAGSIAAAIQTAAKKEAVVIGKPSPIIMEYAIDRLMRKLPALKRENIWVVGDNLLTDIKAGVLANLPTALVLTGISRREDLKDLDYKPRVIANDLEDLIQQLL
ncbi:TIGR01457 family HAD-type hydrolase [Tepidibacillus fermentans]|uniref:Acid sugar phosphatase n=1 Tax=Tepidibacillus fermentans TaxID=1281767 RepID=A0A4R3KFE7_9BACI|nr:TIGR01457 family HAD-type hydrolase [Tepidibacillus fermentans]TCS82094.1 4-nitrophenyl phosphatase [Tepidibacillus fermentans]